MPCFSCSAVPRLGVILVSFGAVRRVSPLCWFASAVVNLQDPCCDHRQERHPAYAQGDGEWRIVALPSLLCGIIKKVISKKVFFCVVVFAKTQLHRLPFAICNGDEANGSAVSNHTIFPSKLRRSFKCYLNWLGKASERFNERVWKTPTIPLRQVKYLYVGIETSDDNKKWIFGHWQKKELRWGDTHTATNEISLRRSRFFVTLGCV